MSKLEAVIFDMDGVLVDSEPWHYEIECQLFRNLNLEVPDEIHRTYVGTDGDFMYSDLKKRYNIGIDLAGLLEWDSRFRVEVFKQMNDIKPNPGLPELLHEIKNAGIKIGIATSSILEIVRIILEKCSIGSYFESITTTEMAGKSKPAPDVYLLAAKSLGFAPSNCIVFEDSFSGIKAAKSAGMYCIAYQPTNNMIQDSSQADKLIRSFHEINVNRMKEYIKAQNYNPKTL